MLSDNDKIIHVLPVIQVTMMIVNALIIIKAKGFI